MAKFTVRELMLVIVSVACVVTLYLNSQKWASNRGKTQAVELTKGITWVRLVERATGGQMRVTRQSFPGIPSFGEFSISGNCELSGGQTLAAIADGVEDLYHEIDVSVERVFTKSVDHDIQQVGFTWIVENRVAVVIITYIGCKPAEKAHDSITYSYSLYVDEHLQEP